MDPSVSGPALAALGEDLFVLSIRPRDGKLLTRGRIDSALRSFIGAAFPPRPGPWVGLPRPGIRDAYATRLISAGVLRMESSRLLGTARYQVIDPSRVDAARSRLDAAAESSRPPDDLAQAALAGLASAIGLGAVLYPGRDGRIRRARLAQIAQQQVIAHAAARTGGDPALLASTDVALAAAVHALTAVIEGRCSVPRSWAPTTGRPRPGQPRRGRAP